MNDSLAFEQNVVDERVQELFRVGMHFGYAKTRPRMRQYIAGVKSNIEIFNAEKIWECFNVALEFLESVGKEGGMVLWVGTKPASSGVIRLVAEELGHPYVNSRWIGGTLTNYKIIRERINYWQDLIAKKKSGELLKYTKQEQLRINHEIEKLTRDLQGIFPLSSLPKALFVIDAGEEEIAIREAHMKNISVVALLNSDCDPKKVSYPIPGNDNASKSISFVTSKAKEAYLKGKAMHVSN